MGTKGHKPSAGARRKVAYNPELLVVNMNCSQKVRRVISFPIYIQGNEQNITFSRYNIALKYMKYKLQDIK